MQYYVDRHDNDCPTDDYYYAIMEEEYAPDTMLTWISSLAIMVLCVGAFLKLFFIPQTVPSSSETCMICGSKFEEYLVPALFMSMANTYGILGISNYRISKQQQTTTTTTDMTTRTDIDDTQDDTQLLNLILSIVPLVTSFLAVLLGLTMMGAVPTSKMATKRALFWISLLSFLGLAFISVMENVNVLSSEIDLHTVVSVGGLVVLWAFYLGKAIREQDRRLHSLIKATSVMVFVVSFGYEHVLYPKCDSLEAYQNCFRDCPLSASQNTNAVINCAVLVATICWTLSENSVPSIYAPKELELSDTTVISFDDSASIDTIEDDLLDITPASLDSETSGSDIESAGFCNDPEENLTMSTKEEHSSVDSVAVDTMETEVPPINDSISGLSMGEEQEERL